MSEALPPEHAAPIPETPKSASARRQQMIREGAQLSCLVGALAAVPPALLGRPQLAMTIVLGTLLASINFVLLARGIANAIDRTVEGVERAMEGRSPSAELEPKDVLGRPHNASSILRLLFLFAVLGGLMWLPPAEPMGLAIGVIVALIGGSTAAYRDHRRQLRAIGPHGS